MIFKNNSVQFIYILPLLFLPQNFIHAAQHTDNSVTEFSLFLDNQTTYFDFPTQTNQVKSDHIGISGYTTFSKTFQGGLEFGYIDMSLRDNSLSSAQFSSGQFFGLLLRFLPVDQAYFSIIFNLNYRYNNTVSINTNQRSEFVWHESLFSSEVEIRPLDTLSLILAAEYLNLSGDQRDLGNISQVTPFTNSKDLGYRFGINFRPYPTADIGVEWRRGHTEGGRIYFRKRY